MGLYDREYYRDERADGFFGASGRSMVNTLIAINVVIYVVDIFSATHWLSELLLVEVGTWRTWEWWRFLTCGFAHDPNNILHIGINMFVLWMFGRDIEAIYGPKEFLRLYLAAILASSATWVVVANLQGEPPQVGMLGASGAISAVLALYALHFPKRTILVMMIIPMPAWAVVLLFIVLDISNATQVAESNVAYTAHLGGFAFGFVYYYFGLNFGRILPDMSRLRSGVGRPRLKVHRPEGREDTRPFETRVDEVLEKFHRAGEESLTPEERKLLEEASRRYQQRRR